MVCHGTQTDGSVSEGGGAASSQAASSRRSGGAGAASRTSSSRRGGGGIASARGGVSDMNSNPPEDGAVDDIFPLNLAMPPIVEWSLHMISVLLESIDSNDGPLGVCVRTIDTHKCLPCCTAEGA